MGKKLVAGTRDISRLQEWVGRSEKVTARVNPERFEEACAFFGDRPEKKKRDGLPELWHWFYFNSYVEHESLGEDGHPKLGGFLPPFDLPRRMWGGSELRFFQPLLVDAEGEKRSKILSVELIEARSGLIGRVRLEHQMAQRGRVCITEVQDLIYREPQAAITEVPRGPDPDRDAEYKRAASSTEPQLFRFSAMTSNAHRIHYDLPYTMNVERYPALLVHGPLTAMRLARFAYEISTEKMSSFSFRAISPLFVGQDHTLCAAWKGTVLTLWALQPSGGVAMRAEAAYGPQLDMGDSGPPEFTIVR
ncbi:MAG: acyl-CoA dehydrogenase [Parvibaculaceae bacterium]